MMRRDAEHAWRNIYDEVEQEVKQLIDKETTENRAANGMVVMYQMEIHVNPICTKQDSWKVRNAVAVAANGVKINGLQAAARLMQSEYMKPLAKRGDLA